MAISAAREELFAHLRREPDVEAADLVAVDATDRLLLDEAAAAIAVAGPGEVVVVDDSYGALTLGVVVAGARDVRVCQDLLVGELALARNAERTGLTGSHRSLPLTPELFAGARLVLAKAPRSLDALREIAELAATAAPDVTVLVGGRVKHMTLAMNDVLRASFTDVSATLARQKSRVLVARGPRAGVQPSFPRRQVHPDLGLTVCAHGAAFAGTRVDVGTRALLATLDRMAPDAATALDLGCGTGVLATALALARPAVRVTAGDQSAAAVASARATAEANGVAGRVRVTRDDAAAGVADASTDLVVCNPPFHVGAAVVTGAADRLFAAAGRVLRPGGELWTVYNNQLPHRAALRRLVGPTRVAAADRRFTVTVSTRR
ncbi:class I SAM-dependent methyltransferase [Geodermatophilus sabuli]|uniref:16S rRNA (Guanine1207-N2)-methyltransferase n=1 Tax=Geodermatophilus sabuli TaxID=1564158 RepID=A0A285EE45_9ACTN|nr:methyltransferase [Geodermatophilus sabuli]MBB3086373.1 16S rRNA (guanine1207-N2)-methyltransferase [Geodermatophilus sabuli]SNX97412.1 16S rRNA (guanine1207-N2)-methyltransferase [Geodermatophilus sabuli]